MRVSVAITGALSMLFVGVWAISEQAQLVEGDLNTERENATYNVSVTVFEHLTNAGGDGMIWFGVAAIVLVACGLLVAAAYSGGGR